MNYRPLPKSRTSAFTLVELLTVITIIAILMGLLFPAIGIAKDQAHKTEAKTAVMGITAAVKAYYTEYGKYPLGAQVTNFPNQDIVFGVAANYTPGQGSAGSNYQLFNILRNINDTGTTGAPNSYNPRAIIFFDGRTVSDPTAPKSGFVPTTGAGGVGKTPGAFMDPWGNEYMIAIDGNYDNQIGILDYQDFKAPNVPATGVCVYSIGKDGILGSKATNGSYRGAAGAAPSDDIVSWQ